MTIASKGMTTTKVIASVRFIVNAMIIAPNTINGMSIDRANDIEKILHDIDLVLQHVIANFRYANDLYCGENYFS